MNLNSQSKTFSIAAKYQHKKLSRCPHTYKNKMSEPHMWNIAPYSTITSVNSSKSNDL